ncbi:hypothetical protein D1Y84_09320 [Acidipila sp. EB88]|nr:hypothetical protein D1Y84_09320 [Acidipila sp. EB88]
MDRNEAVRRAREHCALAKSDSVEAAGTSVGAAGAGSRAKAAGTTGNAEGTSNGANGAAGPGGGGMGGSGSDGNDAGAQAGCGVEIRYLFQVLREQPAVDVLAQVVFAFELARADHRVVGLNFVQPEDGFLSMRDYLLQMSMLDAMHRAYPAVHIALHAGELAQGLVPPAGLRFHVRAAVEQGHAERIGHGVDIMYEERPAELLQEMARRHVLVEINLTSNDVILGVSRENHPLPEYLRAGVPVALSTDDEGVSRIDLTHEYVRAAETYHLVYAQLKQMARASLEHSFLPGASLWQQATPETLRTPVAACRGQLGADAATGACGALVRGSEKATQQWELERRFHTFERSF